jgi:hypothetical protein
MLQSAASCAMFCLRKRSLLRIQPGVRETISSASKPRSGETRQQVRFLAAQARPLHFGVSFSQLTNLREEEQKGALLVCHCNPRAL